MGIPLYFKTIIQSYPNIKIDYSDNNDKCERLFLDFLMELYIRVYVMLIVVLIKIHSKQNYVKM